MNKEEQRIAIAEACGVTRTPDEDYPDCYCWGGVVYEMNDSPDFTEDLNAMHEAEKVLTVKQQHKFAEEVGHIIYNGELSVPDFGNNWYMCYLMMHATASQRAEAFLKTIGKWEDGK